MAVSCSLLFSPAAAAQDCEQSVANAQFEKYFDSVFMQATAKYKAIEKDKIAVMESYVDALLKSGRWTQADKTKFFGSISSEPGFSAPEEKKKIELVSLNMHLEKAFTTSKSSPKETCVSSDAALETLARINAQNEIQWAYMQSRLKEVAIKLQVSLPANAGETK